MHPLSARKCASINKYQRAGIVKHRPYTPLSPMSSTLGQDRMRQRRSAPRQEDRLSQMVQDEYREEMMAYMMRMEKATLASPEMIDLQPELEWYMRPYLIDFIIEVHAGFRLQPATLYLTVNLIDRYTSKRVVFKKHYQLLGCSALWIAAKFEEPKDRVPTLKELCTMCCDSYREEMFIQMESHIIKTLDWVIGHPTTFAFLHVITLRSNLPEKTLVLAQFFTELALFHRDLICAPSTIAEASLFLAQSILHPNKHYTVPSSKILACINTLQHHLTDISNVILKKYSYIGVKKIISDYLVTLSSTHDSLQTNTPYTPSPNHKHHQSSPFHISINTNNHPSEAIVNQFKNTHENESGLPTPPADDNQCNRYEMQVL